MVGDGLKLCVVVDALVNFLADFLDELRVLRIVARAILADVLLIGSSFAFVQV